LQAILSADYSLLTTSIYEAADLFIAALRTTMPYSNLPALSNTTTQALSDGIGLNWLTDAIEAGRDSCNKKILVALIAGLSELLSHKQYANIDVIFRSLDPDNLSPEVLVAVARTSFAARSRLKTWVSMVKRIKAEFERRNLDARGLMQGLA
jgi:hypothetical protein